MDVRTIVIGAGQAGLALSARLRGAGHEHVLLERGRVGERWRSERPDSLTLLTPNWMNVLPGGDGHPDPDGFLDRAGTVAYLERYARGHAAPVLGGQAVCRLDRDRSGAFVVTTHRTALRAAQVVVATGDCDAVRVPAWAAAAPAAVAQVPANRYRRPGALPGGPVLVVGAGPSGQQIALELRRSGRDVVIAVGRHARLPRSYRGRDVWWWMRELGDLHRRVEDLADPVAAAASPSVPLSGAGGGCTLDLGVLQAAGVRIAGRLTAFAGTRATFDDGLTARADEAQRRMTRILGKIDAYVHAHPHVARATGEPAGPLRLGPGPASVDLRGFGAVVWATGYEQRLPWLASGLRPGRTPGLHTLGRRFQLRRSSHLLGGVGLDAVEVAAQVAA